MDTAGIFHTAESGFTDLWEVTWERVDIFLPNLKQELFRGKLKLWSMLKSTDCPISKKK